MQLQVFAKDGVKIRVFMVYDKPYFVAKDVALALGYSNPQKAIREHVREKHRPNAYSLGVNDSFTLQGQTVLVSEPGVYSLIMRSKLESAEEFQDWVVEEVLPSIRKTGGYSVTPTLPQTYADALRALAQEVEEKERLALENKAKAKQIEQDKPKVEFATTIESSTNAITIGAYAKLLSKEHSISVGPNLLFEFLRNDGILLKSKEKKNLPSARYMNNGYFEVSAKSVNGVEILTTLITGKGQIKLLDKIAKHFGKQNHQPSLFG